MQPISPSLLQWPPAPHTPCCSQINLPCTPAAAATAKSLQSCPTLCDPRDGSPPGSCVPEILKARTLEWVATAFSSAWKWKVKVKSFSRVRLVVTPWTAAYQAPLPMGFSRQDWPQVNNREGTQPHPSTENSIKDFLSMAPPIRTRPSFPLSQFLL